MCNACYDPPRRIGHMLRGGGPGEHLCPPCYEAFTAQLVPPQVSCAISQAYNRQRRDIKDLMTRSINGDNERKRRRNE